MTTEQPVVDSGSAQGDGVSIAAAALAKRRWARVEESRALEAATNLQDPEPTTPTKRTAPETEEPAEEASESVLEEGQEEGTEGEEEFEEGAELEEDSEEQPASQIDLDSLDDDAEIIVDGTPTTARELKESRLRLEDYTRKTQAIAQQREVLQQREQLALYHLGKQTEGINRQLQQFQKLNWAELAQRSPQEYQQKRAMAEALQLQAQQADQETKQFLGKIKEAEEAVSRQQAAAAQKELKKLVPGWNNSKYYSLVDYAEKLGFNRKEVLKYTDPGVFLLLDKARAYDNAQTITTQKKVKLSGKRTLRATAPVAPGSQAARKVSTAADEAFKKAQQTGTIDAALEALKARRATR